MNAKAWSVTTAMFGLAMLASQSAFAQEGTNSGPVRLARFSFVQGNVTWRPSESGSWSSATANLPIQQGAQIWVNNGGRAEVQFDDGSSLRLGNNAVVTLQSLYSDSQGEFTELKVNEGTASLHLKDKYSIYQLDTPYESVKSAGPSRFRIDVNNDVRVGVKTGSVTLTTGAGDTQLRSGDFSDVQSANDPVHVDNLPREDAWDRFDESREGEITGGTEYCPPNIAIVAGGLDHYGHWRHDGVYGWVWCPTVGNDWRPYYYGHWVWCDPYGWTWVSDESWGWAPYHYGTWVHMGWGWGWCPGPYHQYWSPAVVSFTSYNGSFCWAPLCPEEVRYPGAFSIGFGSGNWWFNFSIGGCAYYAPYGGGFCRPVLYPWHGFYRPGFDGGFHDFPRYEAANVHFVPRNAAWGGVSVSEREFGQGGRFRPVGNASQYFERGQSVMAANHAFSGPVGAVPSRESITPSHTFSNVQGPRSLNRSLYRAPVTSSVRNSSEPFGRTNGTAPGRTNGTAPGRTGGFSTDGPANVERARQSLGYVGRTGTNYRNNDAGSYRSRSSSSSVNPSRSIERSNRSTSASDAVERARQSLGYSGSGYRGGSSRDSGSNSGSSSRTSSRSNYQRDSQSYSGRSSRSTQGANSSSRDSSSRGGYGGGNGGGSSRGGGDSHGGDSRGGSGGGSRGGDGGGRGH